ncbi:MAG: rhodanese-like domain-containing protein [Salibacteraceae bacterium]|nr:rhodanese-like domain-containing protein [Salibacteraceae bacterium]|tara:strand:- start:8543 stop:8938 length:396 start_codon:yes stop_codon:yes gene_type:complete
MKTVFTLLMSSLFFIACGNNQSQNQKRINDVETEQMKQLIADQSGVLLDVRTADEVREGFIKGAQNIDITQPDFLEKIKSLDKDDPVYVYCKKGGRSANASEKLAKAGFTKVYNMMGGFDSWKDAGYPVEK